MLLYNKTKKENVVFRKLLSTPHIERNETPNFCRDCGHCCKGLPGGYSPDQFESISQVKSLLKSGLAIVDWWVTGSKEIYYLRPKKVTEVGLYSASWPPKGSCIHLTSTGCSLSWEKRPHTCRALRATAPKQCSTIYEDPAKKLIAFAWHNSEYDLEQVVADL